MASCPFCVELTTPAESLFAQRYGSVLNSRIVDREGGFVAMASVGQIFPGSLMLLPRVHVETLAELRPEEMQDLSALKERLLSKVGAPDTCFWFEHGARCISGGGCGIYHAHLHLVPLPSNLDPEEVLPAGYRKKECLKEALIDLSGEHQYLLAGNQHKGTGTWKIRSANEAAKFPSQFFRRQLRDRFSVERPWDWRKYGFEQPLVDTVAALTV